MITMKVHSVIDVITNSSTEIYSYVDGKAVDATYAMLDAIIKSVGSDKKARDMFNVYAGPYPSMLVEYLMDDESEVLMEEFPGLFEEGASWEVLGPRKREAASIVEADPKLYQKLSDALDCDNRGVDSTVHIVAKNGDDSVAKAVEEFLSHFHSEEYNC